MAPVEARGRRTTTLAAQIIDQQVSGIVERHADAFVQDGATPR